MSIDLNDLQNESSTIQDGNSKNQKNYNWSLLRSWGNSNQVFISSTIASLKKRINNAMSTSTDTEVTDARGSYSNLKSRLDAEDSTLLFLSDSGNTVDEVQTIRITDLTTSSTNLKYSVSSAATIDVNKRSQGLETTTVSSISTLEVGD